MRQAEVIDCIDLQVIGKIQNICNGKMLKGRHVEKTLITTYALVFHFYSLHSKDSGLAMD